MRRNSYTQGMKKVPMHLALKFAKYGLSVDTDMLDHEVEAAIRSHSLVVEFFEKYPRYTKMFWTILWYQDLREIYETGEVDDRKLSKRFKDHYKRYYGKKVS